MLVNSGECLRAEVTTLEERADKHLADITGQLRECAMTCVKHKDSTD